MNPSNTWKGKLEVACFLLSKKQYRQCVNSHQYNLQLVFYQHTFEMLVWLIILRWKYFQVCYSNMSQALLFCVYEASLPNWLLTSDELELKFSKLSQAKLKIFWAKSSQAGFFNFQDKTEMEFFSYIVFLDPIFFSWCFAIRN